MMISRPGIRTASLTCAILAAALLTPVSGALAQGSNLVETYGIAFASPGRHPDAPKIGAKATELGSPVAIYEYLYNEFEYLPYYGMRSGSVNTFWRRGGSDVDLAALLIGMLRSQGVPARFAEGTIRLKNDALIGWLGVATPAEAVAILENNGIAVDDAQAAYVKLRHVWVEALISITNYRGVVGQPNSLCSSQIETADCKWIALDVSFKQHEVVTPTVDGLNEANSFDYSRYHEAIRAEDEEYKNRNPSDILERKILDNHAGASLEDVLGSKTIVRTSAGILPGSLPYEVDEPVQRFNSEWTHDNLPTSLSCGENDGETNQSDQYWTRCLKVTLSARGVDQDGTEYTRPIGEHEIPLFLVTTRPTWFYAEPDGAGCGYEECHRIYVWQYDNSIRHFDTGKNLNESYDIELRANLDPTESSEYEPSYSQTLGVNKQHALVAGGIEANANQVSDATELLLDSAGKITRGNDGNYYIDANGNGVVDAGEPAVAFSQPMWDLLHLAAKEYANQAAMKVARMGALTHTRTDSTFFLGLTSAEAETEVLGEAPFAVAPAGLLVDVQGSSTRPYRYQPTLTKYNQVAKLLGYALSAIEHELWQKLTGFDAISTVRGFQKARGKATPIPLVSVSSAAGLLNLYYQAGFIEHSALASHGFTTQYTNFLGAAPVAWYSEINGQPAYAIPPDWLTILKKATDATTLDVRVGPQKYIDRTITLQLPGGPFDFNWPTDTQCFHDVMIDLNATPDYWVVPKNLCYDPNFYGTVAEAKALVEDYWGVLKEVMFLFTGSDLARYVDQETGFIVDEYVYRVLEDQASTFVPAENIARIRNLYYDYPGKPPTQPPDSRIITIPSRLIMEPEGAFFVLTEFVEDGDNNYYLTFLIETEEFSAGGGYVSGEDAIDETIADPAAQKETVKYDNEYHNDHTRNPQSNNGPTCSCTGDPVSTATGNLYHDETDFTIKSHPFDFVFTRTYNSRPGRLIEAVEGVSRTYAQATTNLEQVFWPLGPGWAHSYAMVLISNDFGLFPNDGSFENNDNQVSSVTFIDERGGEVNFKVTSTVGGACPQNDTSCVALRPTGSFADLFNPTGASPSIEFPNGTRYTFTSFLPMSQKNGVAVLQSINDGFGNTLTIDFGASHSSTDTTKANRTQTVTDRANRAITLQHSNGRLQTVSDWTGRTWTFGYDGTGQRQRLTSVTNAMGKTTGYSYATSIYSPNDIDRFTMTEVAFPPRIVDGQTLQRKLSFEAYGNGRAFSTADALGATEFYEYDLFRRQTRVTDPLGHTRSHINDQRGALETLVQQDGSLLRFKNNPDNLRYSKRDAYGRETLYSYASNRAIATPADRDGNVTLERDALNGQILYDYAIATTQFNHTPYRVTREVGRNGTELKHYYATETSGSQVKGKPWRTAFLNSVTPEVPLRESHYFSDGVLSAQNDYVDVSQIANTQLTYDTNHINLTAKATYELIGGALLSWTTYTYDSLNRLKKQSRELGSVAIAHPPGVVRISTEYTYDNLDRVIQEKRPDGSTIFTDYDDDGNPWRVRALYSNAVSRNLVVRGYDVAGRMISETNGLGQTTTFAYDSMGNLLSRTDANGHTVSYEYDAMGRRTKVVNANGNALTTNYDAAGHVESVVDANSSKTRFVRDALGRITETISPMGFRTIQAYDAQGNVTGIKDANVVAGNHAGNSLGYSMSNEYGVFDRLTKTIDADNGETRFEYDRQGNRTAVVDAKSHRTEFHYDSLGRLTSIEDPLLQHTTMQYDIAGNLTSMTDRRGKVTKYYYDAANRLATIDFLENGIGADEFRTYDPYGNLQSIGNAAVTYTYGYDALDRLVSKTDSRNGKSLTWEYDTVGNIIRKTGYEGDVTTYTYDSSNRVVAMSNPEYLAASYHYDPAGRLVDRILSNGARSTFSYDADNRVTMRQEYSGAGSLIRSEKFCYDAVGNLRYRITDPTASCEALGSGDLQSYLYDDLDRLEYENIDYIFAPTQPVELIDYDAVGNIVRVVSSEVTSREYDYDDNNRLLCSRFDGTSTVVDQYVYDQNGNRIEKRNAAGSVVERYVYDSKNRLIELQAGSDVARYEYDPYGYRISQETNGERTIYYLEGEHIESIYDQRGKPKATFLRGAVIDEIIAGYHYDDTGQKTFYTYFHNGVTSVTALADHTGAVAQTYSYSPFGRERAGSGSTPNTLKYTGREKDPTGLYYYRARYYDPETRRFLTEDPLGFGGGGNFYIYAGNNPINNNDPTGKVCLNCATALIGAAAGGVGNAIGQITRNGGLSGFSVRETAVATGVGFLAGAVAPATLVSAAATGGIANLAQYGLTLLANGETGSYGGAALAVATGIGGGLIGGAVTRSTGGLLARGEEGLRFVERDALTSALNQQLDPYNVTGYSSLARTLLGATFSNLDLEGTVFATQYAAPPYPNLDESSRSGTAYAKPRR